LKAPFLSSCQPFFRQNVLGSFAVAAFAIERTKAEGLSGTLTLVKFINQKPKRFCPTFFHFCLNYRCFEQKKKKNQYLSQTHKNRLSKSHRP
jgi:hypothetical protein